MIIIKILPLAGFVLLQRSVTVLCCAVACRRWWHGGRNGMYDRLERKDWRKNNIDDWIE